STPLANVRRTGFDSINHSRPPHILAIENITFRPTLLPILSCLSMGKGVDSSNLGHQVLSELSPYRSRPVVHCRVIYSPLTQNDQFKYHNTRLSHTSQF